MLKKILALLIFSAIAKNINAQAPTITSFSPDSGSVGTLIKIIGTNLGRPMTFTVGGINAIVVSDTSVLLSNYGDTLVGLVMPNTVTGVVSVITTGGTASSSTNFKVTSTLYPSVQQGNKLIGSGVVNGSPGAWQGSSVSISADGNTAIVGGIYDNDTIGAAWVYTRSGTAWSQQGSKLVGTGTIRVAGQGESVSLSADGNTAIVGGLWDNTYTGAVWIFTRSAGIWTQQGNKLIGTGAIGDYSPVSQGVSSALSADGNIAIESGPGDNGDTGAVWIFIRSGGIWTQQGNKVIGTEVIGQALLGCSVSISSDGNTLIAGGYGDNNFTGAAWVFTRSGGVWTQQGSKLVGIGATDSAQQGCSVSISADGNTAIVGGFADGNAIGAAWIYTRSGGVWSQQGNKLVGTGATGQSWQGFSVSISADGNTAIVGGENDNSGAGAVWTFTRSGGVWTQQGNKLVGTGALNGVFGALQSSSISLSADGNTAIAGAILDNGGLGAAWVFVAANNSITTGINELSTPSLNSESFPNPFATSATIKFSVPFQSPVKLELFDVAGKKISVMVDEVRQAGEYSVPVNNAGYGTGMYFYRLQVGENIETKKLIVQ